jgi:hypothetical protein
MWVKFIILSLLYCMVGSPFTAWGKDSLVNICDLPMLLLCLFDHIIFN